MWIDVFLEFIRVNVDKKFEKPVLESTGMLSEGKVGMERVIEALQCNMWPNMIRKPMPKFSTKESDEADEEEKDPKNTENSKEKNFSSNNSAPVHLDDLSGALPIPEYSKTAPVNDFEKEERNLEELGSLMVQMKSLKERIKDMSMEERHANAVDMIK